MSKLHELVNKKIAEKNATDCGTAMHKKLQYVFFDNGSFCGDSAICEKISTNPELCEYMSRASRTEVPIAGVINGEFISRRIDRLYVKHETKTVVVVDYKTDLDRQSLREKYKKQLGEYKSLLTQIYPDYNIVCKILWTSDFTLENIL